MKKFNNVMMMVAFIAICFACRLNVLAAANWTLEPSGWKYQQEDGSFATGRITIDGVEYLFNEFGNLVSETTGWSNEEEAIAIGKEIQKANGWDINPIIIYSSNSAGYGSSNDVISLSKTSEGYEFTIKTKLAGSSAEGFRALCMLIDESVYSDIMNDYSNEVFTPDTWTSYGNYQYYVHVESGLITYKVK